MASTQGQSHYSFSSITTNNKGFCIIVCKSVVAVTIMDTTLFTVLVFAIIFDTEKENIETTKCTKI